MKRKFSFNIPPVKVPGRSDSYTKQTPEPTPSHGSSHRRHHSKGSISPPDSPYISRRPLDAKTEQELRAACAYILQNFKPSDYDFADADPKLDFSGPHKPRGNKTEPSHVKVHKPTGAPAEMKTAHDAKKQSHKTNAMEKSYPDLPMRANTGRRRIDYTVDKEVETRTNPKSPTSDAPKSATIRPEIDSDDAKSLATPLTASTDTHFHNGSTAPTSVGMISGSSSKRTSRHFESAAAVADAQAAEWMRQELEKRRQQQASQPQREPPQSSHRPPTRASSIKAGIREYIFPGSTNLSRRESRESLRTMNSNGSGQPKRSGSSHGWRSWGLQRKSSSRTSSRPNTSSGRVERPEQDKKAELNLNRELPPLPSLDTWKEPEKKEQRKSQVQNAHIATLMRTQDQQDQQRKDYAAAIRKHHRRSGSDTLAMKYTNAPHPVAHSKSSSQQATIHKHTGPPLDVSMDFDKMMSTMSSERNLDDKLKLRASGHVPQRSTSTISHSPGIKGRKSADGRLAAPNFSRKISTDVDPAQRNEHHYAYPNLVQISGSGQKDEQRSKLRRVLSGWMLKKEKKEDWMQEFEKKGVKGGVMIQDDAALPPVVRY